jgi:hypothetical protein
MFCHFGNGLSVCDTLHEKGGDYVTVAHIDADRQVTYYVNLNQEYKDQIEKEAAESDPRVSATQSGRVFRTRPAA